MNSAVFKLQQMEIDVWQKNGIYSFENETVFRVESKLDLIIVAKNMPSTNELDFLKKIIKSMQVDIEKVICCNLDNLCKLALNTQTKWLWECGVKAKISSKISYDKNIKSSDLQTLNANIDDKRFLWEQIRAKL